MLQSDLIRQVLLALVAANFVLFALWALTRAEQLAAVLGYRLSNPNSHSEFGAIYVGVFLAQALLCLLALVRVDDAILGDLVAVFLLMQPVGRLLPLLRHGTPTGLLRLLLVLEVFSAAALFAVRPWA